MSKPYKSWAERFAEGLEADTSLQRMKADRERELREYWQAVAAKVTTAEDVALLLEALLARADSLGLEVRAIRLDELGEGVRRGDC